MEDTQANGNKQRRRFRRGKPTLRKVQKQVSKLRKQVNLEIERIPVYSPPSTQDSAFPAGTNFGEVNFSSTGVIIPLTCVANNNYLEEPINGTQAQLSSILLRYAAFSGFETSGATGNHQLATIQRIVVFKWGSNAGITGPKVSDVLENAGGFGAVPNVYSPINRTNWGNIKVLYDNMFPLNILNEDSLTAHMTLTNTAHVDKYYHKFPRTKAYRLEFEHDSSVDNNDTVFAKNHLFMLMICTPAALSYSVAPKLQYQAVVKIMDA